MFKSKRIISGFQALVQNRDINALLYISIAVLIIVSFFNNASPQNVSYLVPAFSIIVLCITFLFILSTKIGQMYLKNHRINKIHSLTQEIADITETLEKCKTDNDLLAKQIHKDNKILPVMQLSILNLIKEYGETDKIQALQAQLEVLLDERYSLAEQFNKSNSFCGIASTNAIFSLYYDRGEKENINFEFDINKDALDNIQISINDLNTLLCDLCENALIAVRTEEEKSIMLSIAHESSTLVISISDSGKPFTKEVLENMGKQKITTHAETGGSGIGLMMIFEIINRYDGTFEIMNCNLSSKYTKSIVIHLQNAH